MKLSELILRLEQLKEMYGDLDTFCHSGGYLGDIEPVDFVHYNSYEKGIMIQS